MTFAARDFSPRRGVSDEHIPQWICEERATKSGRKRPAALRVAPNLACGFVARRLQPHGRGCALLAPRHRPNWAQRTSSYLCLRPLSRAGGRRRLSVRPFSPAREFRAPSVWISPSSLPSKVNSPANFRLPLISTSEFNTFFDALPVVLIFSPSVSVVKVQRRSTRTWTRRQKVCFQVARFYLGALVHPDVSLW